MNYPLINYGSSSFLVFATAYPRQAKALENSSGIGTKSEEHAT